MSSIGGGRRVGGPQGPIVPAPEPMKKESTDAARQQPQQSPPRDGFEAKGQQPQTPKRGADMPPTQAPPPKAGGEGEARFNELLKQARHDPKALASLLNVLSQAHSKYAGEFSSERSKAETMFDKLAEQKFSKGALDQMRSEIGAQRERVVAARHRMSTQRRRMRALKQLAGRVSDPKVLSEIAQLEEEMEGIQTAWAETYVGLGLGRVLYGEPDEDTPPHLRNVVKASMQGLKRGLGEAEQVGDLVHEIHPARMASRIAASQVTGTPRKVSKEVMEKVRGESAGKHGRAVAAFAAIYELFENEGSGVDDAPVKQPADDKGQNE